MVDKATKEPYADYAAIYERIGQGTFGAQMAMRTLDWMTSTGEQRLRILDLACGTGAASLVFASAGHTVVGVDRSPSMLAIARQKAAAVGLEISYVQQDLRHIRLDELLVEQPFDLITCFFDSLNYLGDDHELAEVCQQVAQLLRPEGLFIFDLQTPKALEGWADRDEVIYDDEDLIVYNRLSYDHDKRRAIGRVVWFSELNERWWRFEETHIERPWSEQQVTEALAGAGMRSVARLTPEGAVSDSESLRVVYYAQRTAEPKSVV
jgi:SAM-dependent methyltransferase